MHEREYGFNFEDKSENDLMQSVYQDAQTIFGINVYYIPLSDYEDGEFDSVWGEIQQKNYNRVYGMRMIAEDQQLMAGSSDLFSKFGLDVQDEVVLYTTRKEFVERITGEEIIVDGESEDEHVDDSRITPVAGQRVTEDTGRPKISDLVWLPIWNSMFEITYIEDNEGMFNGFRGWWKLICKKYKVHESNTIDITQTGIGETVDEEAEDIADIVAKINSVVEDDKDRIQNATDTDVDATGYEPDRTDNILNDDVAVDSPDDIEDDGEESDGDLFSNW